MPQGRHPTITVTLPCVDCGSVVLPADAVSIVCVADTAREATYVCTGCRNPRTLAATAESLSLLHRAGVRVVDGDGAGPSGNGEVEPARQVISLRLLLDQPDFLARLAPASEAQPSRVPPADAAVADDPADDPVVP